MNKDINVGVHCIFINDNNEILLSQRLKKEEFKTYSLPAGHVQENESIEQAAIRELKEELTITIDENDIEVISVAKNNSYINFGILVKKYTGNIINNEPDKVKELKYFNLNNLPTIFSGSKPIIKLYKEKEFYNKKYNI